ncbi:MAG: glycerophosphodiester phosphodiesterase, partial [Alteraurantiacibacter sp.]|nr:glycerophosphodiester phosphodiesterase [Alteraurantiacibacter sp.]
MCIRDSRMTVAEVTATHLALGGEPIPTLRDLLDQVAGRVPVLIELKSDGSRAVLRLCRAVRRDLEGYCGPVAVMSFDPRVPAWFAALAPHILRGLVMSEKESRTFSGHLRRHMALWTGKAQFLAYDVNDLPSRFASAQHARGLPLLAWTVSSPALARRARECGAAPIAEGPAIACLTTGA